MDKKIVLVEWMDATSFDTGLTEKQIINNINPSTCINVGYLIHKNKQDIRLASECIMQMFAKWLPRTYPVVAFPQRMVQTAMQHLLV